MAAAANERVIRLMAPPERVVDDCSYFSFFEIGLASGGPMERVRVGDACVLASGVAREPFLALISSIHSKPGGEPSFTTRWFCRASEVPDGTGAASEVSGRRGAQAGRARVHEPERTLDP